MNIFNCCCRVIRLNFRQRQDQPHLLNPLELEDPISNQ